MLYEVITPDGQDRNKEGQEAREDAHIDPTEALAALSPALTFAHHVGGSPLSETSRHGGP